MKRISKNFITVLTVFLIIFGLAQVTTATMIEKSTFLTTEENNKIKIGLPKIISKAKVETIKTNLYNKVIEGDTETLNISVVPSTDGTTIQVPLELGNGEITVLYKNELGKSFNSGNLYNKDKHSIGVINTELINNDGKAQLTSTVKNNNILQLNVKAKDVSKLIHIQVKMNVTSFATYFTNSEWIHRSGITSLSLSQNPDISGGSKSSDLNKVIKIDAWDKIKSVHSSNEKWYNAGGLQDQFECHFDFAKKKNLWNLEPHRPDLDYFSTVLASCNP